MSQSQEAVRNPEAAHAHATAAEQRAERAEKKIEQLEQMVAELKSEQLGAGNRSETRPASATGRDAPEDAVENLRREPMMAHLMDALAAGTDIGHYGRLVFAMVAHHFLPPEQVLEWLNKDPDFGHDQAIALLRQVNSRDYNPPRRERILAWQSQQEFPILPNTEDPDCGNVYRNLKFPEKVYEHIQEYQEEKAEADGL
jgi:hypothetical protein